jgi:hypothetical protein
MTSTDAKRTPTPTEVAARDQGAHDRLGLLGLLVVQAIIGYEWLISGLAKIFGDFVSKFDEELPEVSKDSPGWFKSVLDAVVEPAPTFWAVAIELGELLIGATLIGAALVWGLRFDRLSRGGHNVVLGLTAAAAFFGILLAIALHLINGASHPWLIPSDGFDEGIDLDSVLPAIQLVILVVSVRLVQRMRRQEPAPGRG